jgi:hypothetical protein
MPASRLSSRRRKSSLANVHLLPARAGYYGIQHQPRPVTFAPNVTPTTYVDPSFPSSDDLSSSADYLQGEDAELSEEAKLFPPSETPAPPPRRKRCPAGKRPSQGYIPRPPNAFMLFRANFVRQKHIPGSIETNHGSLSKIIGNCWRSLPPNEKRVWEAKAKVAKQEHKVMYPDYRFRPVHNKNKTKDAISSLNGMVKGKPTSPADAASKSAKAPMTPEGEERCELVTGLLMNGLKGEELVKAMREVDEMFEQRKREQQQQQASELSYNEESNQAVSHAQDQNSQMHWSNVDFSAILHQPQPGYHQQPFGGPSHQSHRRSSSVPIPINHPHHPGFNHHYQMNTNPYTDPSSSSMASNLMNPIALPTIPFFAPAPSHVPHASSSSRPLSPVGNISRIGGYSSGFNQMNASMAMSMRRASSVGPGTFMLPHHADQNFGFGLEYGHGYDAFAQGDYTAFNNVADANATWTTHTLGNGEGDVSLMRDDSPLPEVDTSLFQPTFGFGTEAPSNDSSFSLTNAHSSSNSSTVCTPAPPHAPPLSECGSSASEMDNGFEMFDFGGTVNGGGHGAVAPVTMGGEGECDGVAPHEAIPAPSPMPMPMYQHDPMHNTSGAFDMGYNNMGFDVNANNYGGTGLDMSMALPVSVVPVNGSETGEIDVSYLHAQANAEYNGYDQNGMGGYGTELDGYNHGNVHQSNMNMGVVQMGEVM